MVQDILTGMRFIADLSNCPSPYKEKVQELYDLDLQGDLTYTNASKYTDFFRQQAWKYYHSNNDMSKLSSAFMMFSVALSFAIEERRDD